MGIQNETCSTIFNYRFIRSRIPLGYGMSENLTEQRELDDRLLECVKRSEKIINRAEMPTYRDHEREVQTRAFDRVLQRILRQELGP